MYSDSVVSSSIKKEQLELWNSLKQSEHLCFGLAFNNCCPNVPHLRALNLQLDSVSENALQEALEVEVSPVLYNGFEALQSFLQLCFELLVSILGRTVQSLEDGLNG